MMLALAAGQLRAETETNMPYVIYDSGSKTQYFLCNTGDPLAADSEVTVGDNTTITIADGYFWKGADVMNKNDYSAPDWNLKCQEATKVVFEPSFANAEVKCCHKWFQYFMYLTTVTGLEYLKTSNETNMSNMFYNCESLTSLDLSSFDTSNVTDMSGMFSGCISLTSLDLSKFDTSKVTYMSNMFSGCGALTSLDLSKFNTSKVTDMSGMFNGCSALTSLDLSKFDTSNLISMDNMFNGCNTLKSLVFGQLNTSNVMSMGNIFKDCNALRLVDLSKATGNKIPDMIGTLPENTYPVIFVPAETTLTVDRKNVISPTDGNCDDLEIDAFSLTSLSFPYGFKAKTITFSRGFTADKPHTLYLPFAIDATAYGTFYTFKEYDKGNQKVVFGKIEDGMTTANTPYLFVPNNNMQEIEITAADGIAVSKTTDITQPKTEGLIGVYKKHTFDDTNKANCYGWTANGEFRKAGNGASVSACRAYLKLPAKSVIGNAPASLSIQLGDGTTGITAVKGGAYGDTDAPMYNLQGQRVDKSYRGVVIKNGKKMIIK